MGVPPVISADARAGRPCRNVRALCPISVWQRPRTQLFGRCAELCTPESFRG